MLAYVRTSNGRQAAIEAGWEPAAANAASRRLLNSDRISRAVRDEQDRICHGLGITARRVVAEVFNVATAKWRTT